MMVGKKLPSFTLSTDKKEKDEMNEFESITPQKTKLALAGELGTSTEKPPGKGRFSYG